MSLERLLDTMARKMEAMARQISELQIRESGGLWTRAAQPLPISSDTVTVYSGALYMLEPETGTTDDLSTIDGYLAGKIIGLRTTTGNTITLKHGVDNLLLPGGNDVDLDDTSTLYVLVYDDDQSAWIPFTSQAEASIPAPSTPTEVAGRINLGTLEGVTLSGDAFSLVADKSFYSVTSETGTSDDLVTINGGTDGDLIVLRPASGHTITALETGNLDLDGSKTLDDVQDKLTLIYDSAHTKWCQVSWSGN